MTATGTPVVFIHGLWLHGGYQRGSNFNRRAWTPAVTGDPDNATPPRPCANASSTRSNTDGKAPSQDHGTAIDDEQAA